jgi:hypothetical protein
MLLHFMHQLPDLGILAITLLAITGAAMLAPHMGRHVLRFPNHDERDDAAFDGYKSLMGLIGVVLAFSLVQANNNLRSDFAPQRQARLDRFAAASRQIWRIARE